MTAPPTETRIDDERVIEVADELEELHRTLIVQRGGGNSADHREPLELFLRHHARGVAGAEFTALLLCTADRWWRAAGRLVRAVEDTALLGGEELDALAETFLDSDQFTVEVAASWAGVRIDLGPGVDPLIPFTRQLRPPLRRWATERLLRRGLVTTAAVLARARGLDGEHQPAVLWGLLDACDALPDDEVAVAVEAGLASSHARVRRRALEVLCAQGAVAEARRRALDDPAAAVRTWGRRLDVAGTAVEAVADR